MTQPSVAIERPAATGNEARVRPMSLSKNARIEAVIVRHTHNSRL
jgi:hypothetical protein